MTKAQKTEHAARVGKAYRCSDGIVRWVIHMSTRGIYHLLWFEDIKQVWYSGGSVRADRWDEEMVNAVEVESPPKGSTYLRAGATGIVSEMIWNGSNGR